MNGLLAATWAEALKVRKSKMLIITLLAFAFIASMMGLIMFVALHPEIAGRSAMLSAKTSFIANPDWPSFFDLLLQIILALGPIGFGMVTSWIFGREYADHVVKDLLCLPVSRVTIVISKFVIIIIWGTLLSLTLFISGLLVGLAVGIPGWSGSGAIHAFVKFMNSSSLTLLLITPVAFFAGLSRGYLLPIGFAILTLIVTNFVAIGLPGVMPYFPWAIPALYSGVAGQEVLPQPGVISYIILFATSAISFVCTAAWWRFADQT